MAGTDIYQRWILIDFPEGQETKYLSKVKEGVEDHQKRGINAGHLRKKRHKIENVTKPI